MSTSLTCDAGHLPEALRDVRLGDDERDDVPEAAIRTSVVRQAALDRQVLRQHPHDGGGRGRHLRVVGVPEHGACRHAWVGGRIRVECITQKKKKKKKKKHTKKKRV